MWIVWLLVIGFIVFVVVLGIISVREETKRETERESDAAWARRRDIEQHIKKYGCSPEELAETIRTSSKVHLLAVEISKHRPKSCCIKEHDIWLEWPQKEIVEGVWSFDFDGQNSISYSSLGLSPISESCFDVLALALEKDPLLSNYEYKYTPGTSNYDPKWELVLKESPNASRCTW